MKNIWSGEDYPRNVTNCMNMSMHVSVSMCECVFWWDIVSPIFFSFRAKRSIPPLLFPSLSPHRERTLYYHRYLLCSARRESNRSRAINPALTLGRIYFCPPWDKAGHGEAYLFLSEVGAGPLQDWYTAFGLRELVLFALFHHEQLIPEETHLLAHSFAHSFIHLSNKHTEDLL